MVNMFLTGITYGVNQSKYSILHLANTNAVDSALSGAKTPLAKIYST